MSTVGNLAYHREFAAQFRSHNLLSISLDVLRANKDNDFICEAALVIFGMDYIWP